jgi:diguanylate cyclase (GGDEF)-like protein/PAS domain S-box-containing protein
MRIGSHFFEWTHKRADGREFPTDVLLTRVVHGLETLLYATVRDITERRKAERELALSNILRTTTMESSRDAILVVDENARIISYNRNYLTMFDIPQKLVDAGDDRPMLQLVTDRAKDPEGFVARVRYLYDHPGETSHDEVEFREGRVYERDTACLYDKGRYLGRAWFFRDITERKKAERELRESEENFRTIFSSVSEGIFLSDVATGQFIDVNPVGCAMFGYTREEIIGSDIGMLSSGVEPYTLERAIELGPEIVKGGPKIIEWQVKAKDGRLFWVETSTRFATFGGKGLLLSTLRDITDRKEAEAIIVKMARYDALTALANRRVFVEELDHAIARARRSDKSFAVLYLDLDHFKDVNDTLGHPVGDDLLKAVGERLRANMREIDTVARFGGDEFAVVMSELADPAEAAVLAQKLLKCIAEPFHLGGNEIRSGTSIGIATYGPDTPDAETLLTQADVALYRAKTEGRGTFRYFTDAMDREVKARVALGAELREAIAAEQFTLYYQPEVEIDTGRILGLEALVRWHHPRRGLLGPGEFIPAAEKSGLIVALGRWVLREACRQARTWLDMGIAPEFIAVNLSILQFKSTQDLEKDIAEARAEFTLPPRMLELELTETVLMDATRRNSDIVQRLRDHGVRIAIDDFGTGYSSLEYLRRLSVDRIKIAQAFVTDLDAEASSGAIVRAALGLARELGLGVIAEGVETKAQLELLRSWGCREVQGFYFAEPRPAQEITKLLRQGCILRPAPQPSLSSPAEV